MAAPSSRRRQVPFLVGLVLILAALPVGWFVFLRELPPPTPPPAPVPTVAAAEAKKAVELELSDIEGLVEVRHGVAGAWAPATKGMALRATDVVRTGDGAYAVLVNGEAVEVRMASGTEVSVEELTDSLSRLLLANGMATTTVRSGQRHTFELTTGSEVVARTGGGTFTMTNNGKGTVSVGTRDGEVALLGNGKVVIVRAGQQSIVRPGKEPTEPAPVPGSLLLKVAWPGDKALRQHELVVTGKTDPGNRVEVEGVVVHADNEGRFERKVVLPEGPSAVKVRAMGVGGLVGEEKRDVVVDTKPPKVRLTPEAIWKTTTKGVTTTGAPP
ncbi:FecR domain-containing protein [Corallococcus sicarius]|uniref:FecR protein domain-containing protein n=1 Tax=Corallococcus sicarius TaxID=2316726 RepID=A0A3A8NMG4_9BACT|nr:FecR domain-containing protein [Corallococcus sicarius]RKH41182.1 hypothetical protein D7X12_18985 [Corallococcus sicarius]